MRVNEMQNKTLVHGGDWFGYAREYGAVPLDFSANTSPLGVPKGVQNAIAAAAKTAYRYPDPLCRALCDALSREEQLPASGILCGNGASDLIYRAVLAQKPNNALVTAPAFAEYEAALQIVNCRVAHCYLKEKNGFRIDESILEQIVPELDMLFLCEPNNPTGVTTPQTLLLRIAKKCRACGTRLILDECFAGFLKQPERHSLKNELAAYPNVLILKAFTKLYGMAGVRLGYCLCSDGAFLGQMRAAGAPWAVSGIAQAAGLAALNEKEYVAQVRECVMRERPWLQAQLAALGCEVPSGEANYLLLKSSVLLEEPLRQRGVLIRSCANYAGLGAGWYRTAVRTHEENEQLITALKEILT